jgi:hypothetical protein
MRTFLYVSMTCVGVLALLHSPEAMQPMLEMQLLIDYITGQLGSNDDQATAAAIVRVVIAGNLVCIIVGFSMRLSLCRSAKLRRPSPSGVASTRPRPPALLPSSSSRQVLLCGVSRAGDAQMHTKVCP